MNSRNEEARFEYIRAHDSWYWSTSRTYAAGRNIPKELNISKACYVDGEYSGVYYEFGIKWHDFSDIYGGPERRRPLSAEISVFCDATQVFTEKPELFRRIALLGDEYTVEQIIEILDDLGFADKTETDQPKDR